MVSKNVSPNYLFSWHSLIWASFIILLVTYLLRNVKRWPSLEWILFNVRMMYTIIRLYLKYLPKGEDGLLKNGFSELNKLKPTPFKVDNILIPAVYIDKPADIQIILNNANSLEKANMYKFISKSIGRSLFGSEVPIWKQHRRLIAQAFQTKVLEEFSPLFNHKNQLALERLKIVADKDQVMDLWEHISILSFDLLCDTQMGIDSDAIFTNPEKRKFMNDVENYFRLIAYRIIRYWLHSDIVFKTLAKIKGWDRLEKDLIESAKKVVQYGKQLMVEKEAEKLNVRKESKNTAPVTHYYPLTWFSEGICSIASEKEEIGGVFLRDLLEAREAGLADVIKDDVIQEVLFMMIAGIETSGLTMCYTLMMLAMRPQLQDEVYKEIIDVMGSGDERLITIEDTERMELLDRCVKETLRLFPIVPIIARDTTAEIKLSDGQVVDEGTMVVIAPYLVHRQPEIYENPLVWDPDHFLPEVMDKRHAYSFIPFSAGPRGCLGNRYAALSMKVTLGTMLKKYRITTDVQMDDIDFKFDFILRSVNGYKVKLHTRNP